MPPPPKRPNAKASGAASKEENIYIPSFISKRPFYAGDDDDNQTDYLRHQRLQKQEADSKWYERGRKAGPAVTKFRKGACDNCGAITHKVKECLERPRALGAKWTGSDIRADDLIQNVKVGWDAKRDRWNGYDVREYTSVVEDYNKLDTLRKQAQRDAKGNDPDADEDEIDEGDRYAEENDMSKHQSTATRQLRIREDTAKYLLNLDLDSAKYDPKTRSLVDGGATADKAADLFVEEGFMRSSGEAAEFERAQRYAWEAQEHAGDTSLHLQANPTAGELLRKRGQEAADKQRAEREKMLMEQYGIRNQQPLPAATRDMAVTESEVFLEYDEYGLIKGAPKNAAKSKYSEDIFINNHTTVWGSWWHDFTWGYACCYSTLKGSYCTGEAGKNAWEDAERRRLGFGLLDEEQEQEDRGVETSQDQNGDIKDDPKEDKAITTRKRTRDEMAEGVTEAEMEEYRRKRTAAEDPMARMLGNDELVHQR